MLVPESIVGREGAQKWVRTNEKTGVGGAAGASYALAHSQGHKGGACAHKASRPVRGKWDKKEWGSGDG